MSVIKLLVLNCLTITPGFCERITRQTSQLVGSGQYGRRQGRAWDYYPVPDRSYSGNIEYVDEIMEDNQDMVEMEDKGRRGVLKIVGVDKRPKCQPIGAEMDCR